MARREKGVGSSACPKCGTDLKTVRLPDGGVAAETCPKCYKLETASKAPAPASVSRETGTDIDTENQEG